jgi:hypothetical protein
MVDLGDDFEFSLRKDKDARLGLAFGLGLSGAIIEGSPQARYYYYTVGGAGGSRA